MARSIYGSEQLTLRDIDQVIQHIQLISPTCRDDDLRRFQRVVAHTRFWIAFDWLAWHEHARRYIQQASLVATADLFTIQRLLTTHLELDRVQPDHFAEVARGGHIRAVLDRLVSLRDGIAHQLIREAADPRLAQLTEALFAYSRPHHPSDVFGWKGVIPGGHVVYGTGKPTQWELDSGVKARGGHTLMTEWQLTVTLTNGVEVAFTTQGDASRSSRGSRTARKFSSSELAEHIARMPGWPHRAARLRLGRGLEAIFTPPASGTTDVATVVIRALAPDRSAPRPALALNRAIEDRTVLVGTIAPGVMAGLGRDAQNALVIDDPFISRQHAQIDYRGGYCLLEDVGSRRGTYLNGVLVAGTVPIMPGDRIRVGTTTLVVSPASG